MEHLIRLDKSQVFDALRKSAAEALKAAGGSGNYAFTPVLNQDGSAFVIVEEVIQNDL